jgi:glyoxalase family protein
MKKLKGIHHVTAITGDAQRNIDFYAGALGMRLVKKTVNFDDPSSYHLYFGDQVGSPGTLLTFFAWPGAAQGRAGSSEPVAVTFQIPKGAMAAWEQKLHIKENDGRLSISDPDGMQVHLLEGPAAAESEAIQRIYSVALNLQDPARSGAIFTHGLQFEQLSESRYQVGEGEGAGYLDIRSGEGGRGVMGAGTIHHLAFRTEDDASQLEWLKNIASLGLHASPVMDRKYFHSIYFREPSGVLFEIATDPPGMAVDEPVEHLGESLALPKQYEAARRQLEGTLPPLRAAVEARV